MSAWNAAVTISHCMRAELGSVPSINDSEGCSSTFCWYICRLVIPLFSSWVSFNFFLTSTIPRPPVVVLGQKNPDSDNILLHGLSAGCAPAYPSRQPATDCSVVYIISRKAERSVCVPSIALGDWLHKQHTKIFMEKELPWELFVMCSRAKKISLKLSFKGNVRGHKLKDAAKLASIAHLRFASSGSKQLDGCLQTKIMMDPHLALVIKAEACSGKSHSHLCITREHFLYLLCSCNS